MEFLWNRYECSPVVPRPTRFGCAMTSMFIHFHADGRSRQFASLPENGFRLSSTYRAEVHSGACIRYATNDGLTSSVTLLSHGTAAFCSFTRPFITNDTVGIVCAAVPMP